MSGNTGDFDGYCGQGKTLMDHSSADTVSASFAFIESRVLYSSLPLGAPRREPKGMLPQKFGLAPQGGVFSSLAFLAKILDSSVSEKNPLTLLFEFAPPAPPTNDIRARL